MKDMKCICKTSTNSAGVTCLTGRNTYFVFHLGPKTEAIIDLVGTDGSLSVVLPLFVQEFQKVHPQKWEGCGQERESGGFLHRKTCKIILTQYPNSNMHNRGIKVINNTLIVGKDLIAKVFEQRPLDVHALF